MQPLRAELENSPPFTRAVRDVSVQYLWQHDMALKCVPSGHVCFLPEALINKHSERQRKKPQGRNYMLQSVCSTCSVGLARAGMGTSAAGCAFAADRCHDCKSNPCYCIATTYDEYQAKSDCNLCFASSPGNEAANQQ